MEDASQAVRAVPAPRGYLDFKAIKTKDSGRIVYVGAIPIFDLIDRKFITPIESEGLTPEILKKGWQGGPVQRKTNAAHVQGILDYIVEEAEAVKPWTFNSIVLYSSKKLKFEGISIGHISAGEARATHALSVGEGLHRCLAWAVALDAAKVRGVQRPEMSAEAAKRIELAVIPALVIEEPSLARQKGDFNKLNRQKPLTSTVLALTDESLLSEITKTLIGDVALFKGRIDLNNASVGVKSDKLLAFAQLRFVVASYLLGRATRSKEGIQEGVAEIVAQRGKRHVRADLKEIFTEVACKLDPLDPLQGQRVRTDEAGDVVREIRRRTLLASSAAWRALFVAIHDAQEKGVAPKAAVARIRREPDIWSRKGRFFVGSLIDKKTKKLLSNRESIDAASNKLLALILGK
jgi:DGQHR domain-containing protein